MTTHDDDADYLQQIQTALEQAIEVCAFEENIGEERQVNYDKVGVRCSIRSTKHAWALTPPRHPEVELREHPDLLPQPLLITKGSTADEAGGSCLVEGSSNSVRVSLRIRLGNRCQDCLQQVRLPLTCRGPLCTVHVGHVLYIRVKERVIGFRRMGLEYNVFSCMHLVPRSMHIARTCSSPSFSTISRLPS